MKSRKTNILIFLFLIAFTAIVAQTKKTLPVKNNAPVGSTFIDSPKVKQPQYQYIVVVPYQSLVLSLDSITMLQLEFGKTKTVDQANELSAFLQRQIIRIYSTARLDSIKLKQ